MNASPLLVETVRGCTSYLQCVSECVCDSPSRLSYVSGSTESALIPSCLTWGLQPADLLLLLCVHIYWRRHGQKDVEREGKQLPRQHRLLCLCKLHTSWVLHRAKKNLTQKGKSEVLLKINAARKKLVIHEISSLRLLSLFPLIFLCPIPLFLTPFCRSGPSAEAQFLFCSIRCSTSHVVPTLHLSL